MEYNSTLHNGNVGFLERRVVLDEQRSQGSSDIEFGEDGRLQVVAAYGAAVPKLQLSYPNQPKVRDN